jgi:hypothetical protein
MQYMRIFKETAAEGARLDDPASAPAYWGAWTAYIGAIYESGIVVSGNVLQPPHTATQVRVADGKRQVQPRPNRPLPCSFASLTRWRSSPGDLVRPRGRSKQHFGLQAGGTLLGSTCSASVSPGDARKLLTFKGFPGKSDFPVALP